jgi:hypothetical protein
MLKSKWLLMVAALVAVPLPWTNSTVTAAPLPGINGLLVEDDDDGGADPSSRSTSAAVKAGGSAPAFHDFWVGLVSGARQSDQGWTTASADDGARVAARAVARDLGVVVVKPGEAGTDAALVRPLIVRAAQHLRERGVLKLFVGLAGDDATLRQAVERMGYRFRRSTTVGKVRVSEFYTDLYVDPMSGGNVKDAT